MSGGFETASGFPGAADPQGFVFVSYRQSDGTRHARAAAWLLRACGLPVWRDREDLVPGDTNRRLDEALEAGVSAALLLVTVDIADSSVVREVELPRLLALERDPNFMLALGNTVRGAGSRLDYEAPDLLLRQPAGTLKRLLQEPAHTRAGLKALARALLLHRVQRRPAGPGAPLTIDIQTRSVPHAGDPIKADLTMRIRPPRTGSLPHPSGLKDLVVSLTLLPEALSASGASTVRIVGGAHLSIAMALGAAMPGTLVGRVDVEDTEGAMWSGGAVSKQEDVPLLVSAGNGAGPGRPTGQRRQVLVYLDLREGSSDGAYKQLLAEQGENFDAWVHLRAARQGPLDPASSEALVAEIAQYIRDLSGRHDNAEVHLLPRCPFPVALLLGRMLNTLCTTVYEWDDDERDRNQDHRPRYLPTLRLRLGAAEGPIDDVLLT